MVQFESEILRYFQGRKGPKEFASGFQGLGISTAPAAYRTVIFHLPGKTLRHSSIEEFRKPDEVLLAVHQF